jgi:F-type H+-transporting ATPase subunit a
MPSGVPMALAPILIPIEILSYLSRPVSLSIRLFANMMAGHTMLKVFGGFSVLLGGALGGLGYTVGILPLVINIALVGFEILVAMLQAYVFTILTCLYIRDALELH